MHKNFEKNLEIVLTDIKKDLMEFDPKDVRDVDVVFNISGEEYEGGHPIVYTLSFNKYGIIRRKTKWLNEI